jgi:D-alanyl-D-alanine carboxypeptidase (penicillin-binding protein 5/6)
MRAWAERKGGGSLMFIDTTMHPKVDELLRGLIVQSGNDAAVALAEGVGGSLDVFVGMMNRQAQAWGLKNTSFKNVAGLTEPGHRSTARDIAVIATHIIRDFPEYFPYYSMKEYRLQQHHPAEPQPAAAPRPDRRRHEDRLHRGGRLLPARHRAARVPEPRRDRRRRQAPDPDRGAQHHLDGGAANESQRLLNWGFQAFDTLRLFDDGKPIATVPVWKGTEREAKLAAPGALFVSVPRGEGGKLQTRVERTDPLVAPLAKGQRVGTIKVVTAAGAPVVEVPLTVMEGVEQAGLLGRAWDAVRLWIK